MLGINICMNYNYISLQSLIYLKGVIGLEFFALLVLEYGKLSEHVATMGTIYNCKCANYVFNVSLLRAIYQAAGTALADYFECDWTLV